MNEFTNEQQNAVDFVSRALETESFELLPLAGDASARRYYRVVQGSESFVLMAWEPFEDNQSYPFLSVLKHFANNSVHVPKVIDLSPQKGMVLLEDLGDLTLERKFWEFQDQKHILPYYQLAVDELIKIHFTSSNDKKECTAFNVVFDTEKFLWEMNYAKKHLLEDFCKIQFTTEEDQSLQSVFYQICSKLDKEPKYICHRDYHSRNLMMKLGSMRVIDFQDARMGLLQYDLASLIYDSYVDLSDESRAFIINDYLEKSSVHLPEDFSTDHFLNILLLQSVQRCFKACGSFASFHNLREDKRYLKHLKHTIDRVLTQIDSLGEYEEFKNILIKYKVHQMKYDIL